MADEPPASPPAPPGPPPDIVTPRRVSKADRIEAIRERLEQGWSVAQVREWATGDNEKSWQISKPTAARYINAALELIQGEVVAPKEHKQSRTRAMLTLFARRAYDLATDPEQKHKAAGLITAGVAALDKIAKIDGSYAYDPSTMLPPSVNPATPEEAVRIVTHAHATMELAIRRGALITAPEPKPVIDATAVEVDEDDDSEGAELDDGSDAN